MNAPGEARKAVQRINDAIEAVAQLELTDDTFGGKTTDDLITARDRIIDHFRAKARKARS